MTRTQRIKTSFQGITVSDAYVRVHFAVSNGQWTRHAEIKVPPGEFLTDEVTQLMDRHVRRRMVEIWSGEPVPSLFDDEQVANNGTHWSACEFSIDHAGECGTL